MMDGWVEASLDGTRSFFTRLETLNDYIGYLMQSWGKVLVEDNRRGVLAGLDKNGYRVTPTNYRTSMTQAGVDRPTYVKVVPNPFGAPDWKTNISGGHADGFKPGAGANLSTRQYKQLSGPPLAPRGMASRIISNYTVAPVQGLNNHEWGVEGGWDDVVDKRGQPFLKYHFSGTGRNVGGVYLWSPVFGPNSRPGRGRNLPQRDMRGLRDWGKKKAREHLNQWIRDIMDLQAKYFTQTGHMPDFVSARRRRRPRAGNP